MTTIFAEDGAAPPSIPAGSARARVCELLDDLLRITLTDGRILVGKFVCFDKQRNVLLGRRMSSAMWRATICARRRTWNDNSAWCSFRAGTLLLVIAYVKLKCPEEKKMYKCRH